MKKTLLAVAAALLLAPGARAQEAANEASQPLSRTILFDHGDMGSDFWRIPALAVTNKGTLVAVADKRNSSNADLPNIIDLAMRRSSDNGLTWSDPVVILPSDAGGGYGDAALGVHRPTGDLVIVCAHGAGLWDATPEKQQRLAVIRSTDDGLTWSQPVDITDQLYSPIAGVAPLQAVAGFASSGTMLCDSQGRLYFVLVSPYTDQKWGPLGAYIAWSDDGGFNWSVNPEPVHDFGDESKVAELADGSLLMSIRNRHKTGRHLSRSFDRGATWSEPRACSTLVDPACNGDLIAITPEQVLDLGLAPCKCKAASGLLIHSMANDPQERRNVQLLRSTDMGTTWQPFFTIAPDHSCYSAIALLPDGTIGCISEEACPQGGLTLWFTKVPLEAPTEE